MYLQLQAPVKVIIPFVDKLAEALGKANTATRINRDFARLNSLIKAVAVIRHHKRKRDEYGRIIAELDDYAVVRELVNDMYVGTAGASDLIRKIVEILRKAQEEDQFGSISGRKLANALGINVMAISRAAKKAVYEGWLINEETKRGLPAKYILGDSLPPSTGLPTVQELCGNTITHANNPGVTVNEIQNDDGNTITSTNGATEPTEDVGDLF